MSLLHKPKDDFLTYFHTSYKVISLFLLPWTFLYSQITKTEWIEWELPQSLQEKHIRPKYISSNQFHDIYLLDDENYWLIFIPEEDNQPRIAGGWGDAGELFSLPTDLEASHELDVLVCDNETHRLLRFDRKLNFIADLRLSTLKSNGIEYPNKIAKNGFGEIIIASSEDSEIHLVSKDGQSIIKMGDATYGEDRFLDIEDIDISDKNEIGLIDIGAEEFVILSRDGQIVNKVPLPDSLSSLVHWWQNRWLVLSSEGDIYDFLPDQNIFRHILDFSPFKRELFPSDCTTIEDTIFVIDELSGKIFKAELELLE